MHIRTGTVPDRDENSFSNATETKLELLKRALQVLPEDYLSIDDKVESYVSPHLLKLHIGITGGLLGCLKESN